MTRPAPIAAGECGRDPFPCPRPPATRIYPHAPHLALRRYAADPQPTPKASPIFTHFGAATADRYASLAACQQDTPRWRDVCKSCIEPNPIGCPTWAGSGNGNGTDYGLFRAWINAPVPPVALHSGWAGGSPSHDEGLPGGASYAGKAIAPAQCNLTHFKLNRHPASGKSQGGATLNMTLHHAASQIEFLLSITLTDGSPAAVMNIQASSTVADARKGVVF